MTEAIVEWKQLDDAAKQNYKERAASSYLSLSSAASHTNTGSETSASSISTRKTSKGTSSTLKVSATTTTTKKATNTKSKAATKKGAASGDDTPKRPQSGYQLYVSESMKSGKTMKDSVSAWKQLDEATQQIYKDRVNAPILVPEDALQ